MMRESQSQGSWRLKAWRGSVLGSRGLVSSRSDYVVQKHGARCASRSYFWRHFKAKVNPSSLPQGCRTQFPKQNLGIRLATPYLVRLAPIFPAGESRQESIILPHIIGGFLQVHETATPDK